MCGIFGIYSPGRVPFEMEDFQKVNNVIQHRGPDDAGIYYDENIFLGHRRLSIIDLSPLAHQPMSNEDGTIWIIFNGEIYNYLELNKELKNKGHYIRSKSDTETIVHLYEEYGKDCVEHLRGMFSFAIWDKKKKRLFTARDRLGIKPFLYVQKEGLFIFASEIKALLASGLVKKEIDPLSVSHYLSFGAVPAPLTILKGVCNLLPGHWLCIEDGKVHVERYWEIKFPQHSPNNDKCYWGERLRELLEESIKIHLVSDVPLGAFLSGGVDSSIVVGLMSKMTDQPVKTFSIGYDVGGKDYNETNFAKLVANKFVTDHTEITIVEEEVANALDKIIWYMDQPSHDALNSYFVSRAAKTGVTVALSGLGGDELLAGYSTFKFAKKLQDFKWISDRIPKVISSMFRKINSLVPLNYQAMWLWRGVLTLLGNYSSVEEKYELVKLFFTDKEKSKILTDDFKAGLQASNPSESIDLLRSLASRVSDTDIVNQVSYLELNSYLCDTLLRDIDVMSMAHSLEVRVPLIDHKLVEFAATIPPELKLNKAMVPKYILKESVKNILPKEILYRKKMGFGFPMSIWLRKDPLKKVVDDCLSKESVENRGILNYKVVKNGYDNFYGQKRIKPIFYQLYQRLWMLVVLELWCRKYLDE